MRKVGGRRDEGFEEDEEEVSLSGLGPEAARPHISTQPPLYLSIRKSAAAPCQPIVQLFRSQPMSHLCTVKSGNVVRLPFPQLGKCNPASHLNWQPKCIKQRFTVVQNPGTTSHLCVNQTAHRPNLRSLGNRQIETLREHERSWRLGE